MSIAKVGDVVRIKDGAYNVADHRFGRTGTVSRIDSQSKLLPVRVEYGASSHFNWTNHESLEIIKAAGEPELDDAEIGKDIIERMRKLKALIVARDIAVKSVIEETEQLDALLTSVGLKRSEEISPIPVRVQAGPRTALDDVVDETVTVGSKYRLTAHLASFSKGMVYMVSETDETDDHLPLALTDDEGDDSWPNREELKHFVRV